MRWFKALPSRPFGAANSLVRQRTLRSADNWGLSEAREVIPQPQPQPITSKETRRCMQAAQVSRAPRKPFDSVFKDNLQGGAKDIGAGTRVSLIVCLANRMAVFFRARAKTFFFF